jgi:hypothetical protein
MFAEYEKTGVIFLLSTEAMSTAISCPRETRLARSLLAEMLL